MNFSRRQIALTVSLLFHAALLGVLVFWYVPNKQTLSKDQTSTPLAVDESDAKTKTTLTPPTPPLPPTPPPIPVDVPSEQIASSVESKVDQVAKLTDPQKLSELDKSLKRLESVASLDSVQEVSETIAETMGVDTQQYADKESAAPGEFEIDTAQIKDVLRTKAENGNWVYESIMVDAGGREMSVPMTEAEGQQVYDTFERLKQFPMAKSIYQSVVMPMLQKMLEETESESAKQ